MARRRGSHPGRDAGTGAAVWGRRVRARAGNGGHSPPRQLPTPSGVGSSLRPRSGGSLRSTPGSFPASPPGGRAKRQAESEKREHGPGLGRRDAAPPGVGRLNGSPTAHWDHEPRRAAFPGCRFGGLSGPSNERGAGKPPEPAGRKACPTGLRFRGRGAGKCRFLTTGGGGKGCFGEKSWFRGVFRCNPGGNRGPDHSG